MCQDQSQEAKTLWRHQAQSERHGDGSLPAERKGSGSSSRSSEYSLCSFLGEGLNFNYFMRIHQSILNETSSGSELFDLDFSCIGPGPRIKGGYLWTGKGQRGKTYQLLQCLLYLRCKAWSVVCSFGIHSKTHNQYITNVECFLHCHFPYLLL